MTSYTTQAAPLNLYLLYYIYIIPHKQTIIQTNSQLLKQTTFDSNPPKTHAKSHTPSQSGPSQTTKFNASSRLQTTAFDLPSLRKSYSKSPSTREPSTISEDAFRKWQLPASGPMASLVSPAGFRYLVIEQVSAARGLTPVLAISCLSRYTHFGRQSGVSIRFGYGRFGFVRFWHWRMSDVCIFGVVLMMND